MADVVVTFNSSSTWVAPTGVTAIKVEAYGGGGGGAGASITQPRGAGGGGAYAAQTGVPVTPGNTYTVTVGTGGAGTTGTTGGNGSASTFIGDSSTTVSAVGGQGGQNPGAGAGGAAASSTGVTKFSGGNGGAGGVATAGGGGGGEAAGPEGNGNNGANAVGSSQPGKAGGSGATSGGDGGAGGGHGNTAPLVAVAGSAPGGGGGASGSTGGVAGHSGGAGAAGRIVITYTPPVEPSFIASTTVVYTPVVQAVVNVPFIASATLVYAPSVQANVNVPFIASATVVFDPTLSAVAGGNVDVPFIDSTTVVYPIDVYSSMTGPGNGGETFGVALAPNGVSVVASLAADLTATATSLSLTADDDLPTSSQFCLAVDDEILLVTPTSPGIYRIVQRPLSNTTAAAHADGSDATWTDTYAMAVEATNEIASSVMFEGDDYDAWLIAFDSSQAYLSGDRYTLFVAELLGVFPPGTGAAGTNRLDAAQPSAIHATEGVTENCPVGLTVPARVVTTIAEGDVALLRYTNPEASVLTLGPRSTAIQSWYGFMRVDASNVDVTATDPSGTVVDGAVEEEFYAEPFVTTTLLGDDRTFTYGPPRYSDRGWPLAALAIRQGKRRVPLWTSPNWHDFSFVYSGFGDDATFVQVLINRNGFDPSEPDPTIDLPGSQDIDGPNATWDDGTYYTSTAWYVGIFKSSVLLGGPILNPPPPNPPPGVPPPPGPTIIPTVPPGGGDVVPPVEEPEGGSGGDISPPGLAVGERFWVATA